MHSHAREPCRGGGGEGQPCLGMILREGCLQRRALSRAAHFFNQIRSIWEGGIFFSVYGMWHVMVLYVCSLNGLFRLLKLYTGIIKAHKPY